LWILHNAVVAAHALAGRDYPAAWLEPSQGAGAA
jgi:hypothetical protein